MKAKILKEEPAEDSLCFVSFFLNCSGFNFFEAHFTPNDIHEIRVICVESAGLWFWLPDSDFGFRASFGLRPFGFRPLE